MKLRLTVLLAGMMLLLASIFIPDIMLSSMPKVNVTKLEKTVYNQYLNCSGSIEVEKKSNVSLEIPVKISHIEVEVGDYVRKGDRIAVVDKDATVSAYSGLNTVAAVSALMGSSVSAIPENLLSQYVNSGEYSITEILAKYKDEIKALPTVLTAPEDGVITEVNAQEGEMSSAFTPIITIAQSSSLVARVSVSESNISKVREGQKATLTVLAQNGSQYNCTVSKIYPTAQKALLSTSKEAMVDVILKIRNPDKTLRPGYSIKGKILIEEGRKAYVLPYEAIGQDDEQKEFVFVYSGGRVHKQLIKTDSELLNGIEIKSGVNESDYIVTNPTETLKDNTLVCLLE
ncbi:efflux RND transporter periplasmic adaptor subunit [Acetanaerobacterium elongatum]|uniref:RND family efflux transporter, MFP subunit n=1 Tax=Acetanaerobacterium elongatum TaxID=258515 RepID=A0A1H0BDS4_9FIRM|nr:efflux RND transporter periplasmic adaptor subunit [Acetanaerobacterium elongatum]SDN43804.1 RND family efflux transporter, MFP subunit [Acetanaerobacterium elongatum]